MWRQCSPGGVHELFILNFPSSLQYWIFDVWDVFGTGKNQKAMTVLWEHVSFVKIWKLLQIEMELVWGFALENSQLLQLKECLGFFYVVKIRLFKKYIQKAKCSGGHTPISCQETCLKAQQAGPWISWLPRAYGGGGGGGLHGAKFHKQPLALSTIEII